MIYNNKIFNVCIGKYGKTLDEVIERISRNTTLWKRSSKKTRRRRLIYFLSDKECEILQHIKDRKTRLLKEVCIEAPYLVHNALKKFLSGKAVCERTL